MSKIEVDAIDKQSGSTLTLGGSGTAVTLASGATQTGFGRTGTVDWQTTPKTTTFTAVSGEGYFANTSGGAFVMNLPAGSAGAIVSVADYTRTFQTNPLTITPNGSEKIGGVADTLVANTEGQSLTFIYVDGTEGWINTSESEGKKPIVPAFVAASVSGSGNTLVTVDTNYKVATFTGPGTFTVSCAGNPAGSDEVSYTVVAGGGAGGNAQDATNGYGGGAGAGGYREGKTPFCSSWSTSPLATIGLPVSAVGYPITIGAGGAAKSGTTPGTGGRGADSIFSTITSTGGGGGQYNGGNPDAPGGSGGGAGNCGCVPVGAGNTPPVSPPQGKDGGAKSPNAAGGGGGATVAGTNGNTGGPAGPGGAGATNSINGTPTARAGGGGGGGNCGETGGGSGGAGGGGAGGNWPSSPGTNGTANTGGGGGATSAGTPPGGPLNAGTGGSGIVIIRYKFQ